FRLLALTRRQDALPERLWRSCTRALGREDRRVAPREGTEGGGKDRADQSTRVRTARRLLLLRQPRCQAASASRCTNVDAQARAHSWRTAGARGTSAAQSRGHSPFRSTLQQARKLAHARKRTMNAEACERLGGGVGAIPEHGH